VDGNPLRTIKRSVLPNTMELKKYLRTRGAPLPGMPAIDEGDEAMEMGVGEEGVDEPGGAGFRLLLQDKTRHVNRWVRVHLFVIQGDMLAHDIGAKSSFLS